MVSDSPVARYAAEFLGTFMLVFTVGCNVLVGSPVWGVTSIACLLTVAVYSLGAVSGAHLNPAVTCAIFFCQKIDIKEAAIYVGVQLLGGLVAGYTYLLVFGRNFNLAPAPGFSFVGAGNIEFLYTFLLCFVVLNCACASRQCGGNQYFGLAIGFVIVAGGYAGGWISGGCFNPAVAFGIDASSADLGFGWCLVYTGYEILAALFAAGVFRVVHPEEFDLPTWGTGIFQKLLCEFIGTFFLVLTVGLNVIGGSKAAAFSIAASLMACIYALGPISGAHLNPAVTFGILCSGRGKVPDAGTAAAYMATQVGAGVAAGITYSSLTGAAFSLAPGPKYGFMQTGFAETAFTFLLVFVVLSVATIKQPLPDFFGLAIASCVTAGGYAIGSISGGSLNPAVSFGLDTANAVKGGGWSICLLYTLFEMLGGALAAMAFFATHQEEYTSVDPIEEKNP